MSKSIIIKKNGGPEVLEIAEVKIGSPGPHEIKIKNLAIGLNYIDTYHRSGLYPLTLPSGIGLEGAGKVIAICSNVKKFNIGDRIKGVVKDNTSSFGVFFEIKTEAKNYFFCNSWVLFKIICQSFHYY